MDIREMRSWWDVSPQISCKEYEHDKSVLRICVANEWLTRNPARHVKKKRTLNAADNVTNRNSRSRMMSLQSHVRGLSQPSMASGHYAGTDRPIISKLSDQIKSVQPQMDRAGPGRFHFGISVYTGIRISDMSTFHIASDARHRRNTYPHDKSRDACLYLGPSLAARARSTAGQSKSGRYIFGEHKTTDMNVVTDVWRRKLKNLWKLCGPWKENPTPHRFRHTFARILLQRPGGDHPGRRRTLQAIRNRWSGNTTRHGFQNDRSGYAVLKAAFSERPRPNVVEMRPASTS